MRGPRGVYYYTSFPPLGFVAPWAFFRVTGLAPSIEHLLVFSLVIHLVATFLIAFLIIHDVDDNYFSGLLAGEVASRIHSLYDVCRTRFGG